MRKRIKQLFFFNDDRVDHFKPLDGLRGIAVLFVMLSHSSNVGLIFHDWINFQKAGKTGVYLFFVLSSYLLDRQIAKVYLSGKSTKTYWKNYFLRRFLRIYPLFAIALVIHFALTLSGFYTVIDEYMDVPLHLLLIKGESIFWSIPVEFKYYFISPLFMWMCHRFFKWRISIILLFFAALSAFSIVVESIFELPITSTLKYLPIFLVGALLSIIELLKEDFFARKLPSKSYSFIGWIAIILLLLSVPYYSRSILNIEFDPHLSSWFLPFAILWGIVLLSAKYGKGLIHWILSLRILRFIGVISFSLYLFHVPVLKLAKQLEIPDFFRVYAFFLISITVATISYLLIERPLSKIRIKK